MPFLRAIGGLLSGVAGNALLGGSQVLQKFGISKALERRRPRYREPWWLAAMALQLIGELGNLLALTLTSPAVVAPLGSLAILVNAFVSQRLLKEEIDDLKQSGFLQLIVGVLCMLTAVPLTPSQVTTDSLVEQGTSVLFLSYFSFTLCIAIGAVYQIARRRARSQSVFEYAILVGLIGSYTILSTKIATSLFALPDADVRFVLAFAGITSCGVALQETAKQAALTHFESSRLFPSFFAAFNTFTLFVELAFFQELGSSPLLSAALITVGIALVVNGTRSLAGAPPVLPLAAPAAIQLGSVTDKAAGTSGAPGNAGGLFRMQQIQGYIKRILAFSQPAASHTL